MATSFPYDSPIHLFALHQFFNLTLTPRPLTFLHSPDLSAPILSSSSPCSAFYAWLITSAMQLHCPSTSLPHPISVTLNWKNPNPQPEKKIIKHAQIWCHLKLISFQLNWTLGTAWESSHPSLFSSVFHSPQQ